MKTHLKGLEKGIDGLVGKDLGDDGVPGHPSNELGLGQLVILVPGENVMIFASFFSPFLLFS